MIEQPSPLERIVSILVFLFYWFTVALTGGSLVVLVYLLFLLFFSDRPDKPDIAEKCGAATVAVLFSSTMVWYARKTHRRFKEQDAEITEARERFERGLTAEQRAKLEEAKKRTSWFKILTRLRSRNE